MTEVHQILKYKNRKIYDRATGSYTTARELAFLVASGADLSAWDDALGEDATVKVLARTICEGVKAGLPVDLDLICRLLKRGRKIEDKRDSIIHLAKRAGSRKLWDEEGAPVSLKEVSKAVRHGHCISVVDQAGFDVTVLVLARVLYQRVLAAPSNFSREKLALVLRSEKRAS